MVATICTVVIGLSGTVVLYIDSFGEYPQGAVLIFTLEDYVLRCAVALAPLFRYSFTSLKVGWVSLQSAWVCILGLVWYTKLFKSGVSWASFTPVARCSPLGMLSMARCWS